MKRFLNKKFAQYQSIDCGLFFDPVVPDYVVDDTDLNSVLNEIFTVDPVSGLPRGDIQYFLSKDGNPEVKAWLESNLLVPRARQTGSSIDGVTDDMIVEFSRQSGESVSAYASRLRSIYDSAKAMSVNQNPVLNPE